MSRSGALAAVLALSTAGSASATPPPVMAQAISPASAAKVGALPDAPAGSVVVKGPSATLTLSATEIAAAPHERVSLTGHDGRPVDYSGPLLSELLRQVGAPLGVRLHGTGVNDVVFVTGADRFRAVLSLAEIDPGFHKGAKAILADQADGKPLAGKEAPYRLIVDGDLRPARSVYAVVSIAVQHLP